MATTQNAVNGRSGTVINKVRTTSNTIFTGSYPSITKGTVLTTSNTIFLCSLTIAPESSSNVLVFNANIPIATGGTPFVCLFQGTTLLCLNWDLITGSSPNDSLNFIYQQAAGTTSSTTYSIYYVDLNATTDSRYVYINELGTSETPIGSYNNSLAYTFTITEEIA